LRVSFFASDRQFAYSGVVKPFADAINLAGHGTVALDVYTSGALERGYPQQLRLVQEGGADIAWVNPGLTPELFPDNAVMELPGLFRDAREATQVFADLAEKRLLRGYDDLMVIGAFGSAPLTLHTRVPALSLADLKGKRIRAISRVESELLKTLGMEPMQIPINQTSDALNRGAIDGTSAAMEVLADFGISRFVNHHYLVGLGSVPLLLVMNRRRFEELPESAKQLIRDHSGKWVGDRYVATVSKYEADVLKKLKADSRRKFANPSPAELSEVRAAFKAVIEDWAADNPRGRELLATIEVELAKLRATR
jgi:TRAP-type C4-dicarboxylate transport system substrate-binding protein